MALRKAATKTSGYRYIGMVYTADEVLGMLDSSGESDIEEDPGFLLPHGSDSEGEEPH